MSISFVKTSFLMGLKGVAYSANGFLGSPIFGFGFISKRGQPITVSVITNQKFVVHTGGPVRRWLKVWYNIWDEPVGRLGGEAWIGMIEESVTGAPLVLKEGAQFRIATKV